MPKLNERQTQSYSLRRRRRRAKPLRCHPQISTQFRPRNFLLEHLCLPIFHKKCLLTIFVTTASKSLRRPASTGHCQTNNAILKNDSEPKGFSWASVTKSLVGDSIKPKVEKIDLNKEQRLCQILKKFISEFKCTYEEARALLDHMQTKFDHMTSTPLDAVVDAAKDIVVKGHLNVAASSSKEHQTPQEDLPWNYKTVMCNFFKEGVCRQGDNCMFAHSKAELRAPFIPMGYCISYVTKNVCKWGSACNYLHAPPNISRKANQATEKLKLINQEDKQELLKGETKPFIPVGLNYVKLNDTKTPPGTSSPAMPIQLKEPESKSKKKGKETTLLGNCFKKLKTNQARDTEIPCC